jgi:hypothetical protein
LKYANESGALNEGFSDIWGAVVEHYKTPSKQIWLIGEDIVKEPGRTCLRSMSEPASAGALSPAPSYYGRQDPRWKPSVITPADSNDYGGVHTNSGVLNHWFYLLSVGKSGTNEGGNAYSVTGIGIGAAATIAYRAESVYLWPESQYADARTFTIEAASDLYGAGSPQVMATTNAWYAVGVGAAYSGGTPSYCVSQGTNLGTWIDLVSLGTINRPSGPDGGYYDGTGTSTSVAAGSTQTIRYSAGFTGSAYVQNWKIYIDYNQDGDFTDADEMVVSNRSSADSTLSSRFTVPTTAREGTTRLRVVMSYYGTTTSCGLSGYSETEDYTLIITGGAASAGAVGRLGVTSSAGLRQGMSRGLELYPNPASDVVRILLPDNAPLVSVTLTDMRGAQVSGVRLEGDHLNVAALAKGVYTLTVSDGQQVFHQRFVKQ